MAKVLIVGCGDLGSEVARQLVALDIQTIAVRRSANQLHGVTFIQADVTHASSLAPLEAVQPEILIYCIRMEND